ncbi:hypothetical protein GF360_04330 [candidate division WWE3 bacterium]|nr:hypothetical protein [candidate division WWE3 bacterium]
MTKIDKQVEQLEVFKVMAQTYQEVAAMRMRKMKDNVLRNREFLSGLSSVFARVKLSYRDTLQELLKRQGITDEEEQARYIDKMNFTRKNGRDIIVLASANTGLYGDIVRKVFEYFAQQVDPTVEVAVLGRVGKLWFQERFPNKPFLYFDLSDGDPNPDEIHEIMEKLSEYENVLLFHGKFKDILEQMPEQTGVSGDAVTMETREDMRVIRSIFEPSLEEIFEFFESEIKSSLFEHALYESALSKYTSRMVSLDRATSSASRNLEKLKLEQSILDHREKDRAKNTLLAGVLYGR